MRKIELKEDLTVEFKSDRAHASEEDIVDAAVAFANTEDDDLYLGVEDDGEITGAHKKHTDTTRLAALIANRTVPPVSARTEVLPRL